MSCQNGLGTRNVKGIPSHDIISFRKTLEDLKKGLFFVFAGLNFHSRCPQDFVLETCPQGPCPREIEMRPIALSFGEVFVRFE